MWPFKKQKNTGNIQQWIQLEEKIKHDVKQQLLQELASKSKAENKVMVESIPKVLVEQQEKNGFWVKLGNFNKLLVSLSSVSAMAAGVLIFLYLNEIGSRQLFAGIVSQPSVFLSVVILFVIFIGFVAFPVYMPFFFTYAINGESKRYVSDERNIQKVRVHSYLILIIISFLIQIFIICSMWSYQFGEWVKNIIEYVAKLFFDKDKVYLTILVVYFTLSLIGVFFLWFSNRKYIKNKKCWRSALYYFIVLLIYFFINLVYSMAVIFAISLSKNWFNDPVFWLRSFLFCKLISLIIASSLLGFGKMAESEEDEEKVRKRMWFAPMIVLIFYFMLSLAAAEDNSKFKQHLFKNLGYIETPEQARWYLLDKRYIEQNALRKDREEILEPLQTNLLELWRNKFKPLPRINTFNYRQTDSFYANDRRYFNAFYGYMAWNVGEIKIFCPQSVKLDKEVADKCFYIKSDYLHLLPKDI